MVAILLVALVFAYANAVDDHGTAKQAAFWGKPVPTDKEKAERFERPDYVITPQNLQRFGVRFGGEK